MKLLPGHDTRWVGALGLVTVAIGRGLVAVCQHEAAQEQEALCRQLASQFLAQPELPSLVVLLEPAARGAREQELLFTVGAPDTEQVGIVGVNSAWARVTSFYLDYTLAPWPRAPTEKQISSDAAQEVARGFALRCAPELEHVTTVLRSAATPAGAEQWYRFEWAGIENGAETGLRVGVCVRALDGGVALYQFVPAVAGADFRGLLSLAEAEDRVLAHARGPPQPIHLWRHRSVSSGCTARQSGGLAASCLLRESPAWRVPGDPVPCGCPQRRDHCGGARA